jgi:hypothetical protein
MDDVLLFTGTRWGGAKVVDRRQVVIGRTDTNPNGKVLFDTTLIVETTGEGRDYSVDFAEAWWRDFAELPLADERRVLSFLQRRGDPLGLLAPSRQISTCDWYQLRGMLGAPAVLWDPVPDETGVSHFRPENLPVVLGLFDSKHKWPWTNDLSVVYRNAIPGQHAKTLAAYMWASAAASLRGRRPMRRCDFCHSWFTLNRSDARWCSGSCRAAGSNQRKSPHAFVS